MLWLVTSGRQFITFVDPKGIRNLDGLDDPKIRFRETIKDVEDRIGDPEVTLNSCIISVTAPHQLPFWGTNRADMEAHNVFFQDDEGYMVKVLKAALRG